MSTCKELSRPRAHGVVFNFVVLSFTRSVFAKYFPWFRGKGGWYTGIPKIPVSNHVSVWRYDFFSHTDIPQFSVYQDSPVYRYFRYTEKNTGYETQMSYRTIDISC